MNEIRPGFDDLSGAGTHASLLLGRSILPLAGKGDSLVVTIAEWIGQAIIQGALKPGDDLNSVDLAERFKTSRTPVREALLLLEKEGLVEIPPRRRPRVAALSVEESAEIYQARGALIAAAAERVAIRATDEQLATLQDAFAVMDRCARAKDLDGYFWANTDFHELLLQIAGNATIARILNSLGVRTLQLRHYSMSLPGRMQQSRADHERLLRAFVDRDPVLASALVRANLRGAFRAIESTQANRPPARPE